MQRILGRSAYIISPWLPPITHPERTLVIYGAINSNPLPYTENEVCSNKWMWAAHDRTLWITSARSSPNSKLCHFLSAWWFHNLNIWHCNDLIEGSLKLGYKESVSGEVRVPLPPRGDAHLPCASYLLEKLRVASIVVRIAPCNTATNGKGLTGGG